MGTRCSSLQCNLCRWRHQCEGYTRHIRLLTSIPELEANLTGKYGSRSWTPFDSRGWRWNTHIATCCGVWNASLNQCSIYSILSQRAVTSYPSQWYHAGLMCTISLLWLCASSCPHANVVKKPKAHPYHFYTPNNLLIQVIRVSQGGRRSTADLH